ncbi:hypothetical protein [Aquimarina sp. MMG016]|uniref:hypothetical protein n=1 Tax=Aquimarina sp. MMG016 TaxID=2822690 RepID=UPI001B3A2DE2|nr:hypothetical protein [Aquimarina sp. MMG016]MBQ4819331.1 hypothetical protein [Aquimarina sp. MMG016]
MKKHVSFWGLLLGILLMIGCQPEEDIFIESEQSIEDFTELNSEKNNTESLIVCSTQGIPPGYVLDHYLNVQGCPNQNLFLGRYNAALVRKIRETPQILRAGAGCDDNFCIWIVGDNFESNAYVDIRTTAGSSIIGTYRGSDRVQYVNSQGQDVITLRLGSAFERNQFANNGLRIWVVNPVARTWADGRTVRRPRDIIIDPPCDPICP